MVVAALVLFAFAGLDLWAFVQGAPPMWALLDRGPSAVHGLLLAVHLLDCAFLVSLLVSAMFLVMRSRWAVVLAIGQLPVRILCGYGTLSGPLLSRISRGPISSPLLLFLILILVELARVVVTLLALRQGSAATRRLGQTFTRRRLASASLSGLVTLLALGWVDDVRLHHLRWRLQDGSILTLSPGAHRHSATRTWGRQSTTVFFAASERILGAECRMDEIGDYWLVTTGDTTRSVPVYFSDASQALLGPGFGKALAPEVYTPSSGKPVAPVRFILWPSWPRPPISNAAPLASLLKRVDANLFFPDQQLYAVTAISWQGDERPGLATVDTLGVRREADRGRTSIDWEPACGPWNLRFLMRFELDLFSRPWSKTFASDGWKERTIEPVVGGWRLRFVPRDSLGGPPNLNAPVVRGFQAWIDTTGVPRQGFCELDMKAFPARGLLGFEYEKFGNKLRIQTIHHQIDMASVRITPDLDLRYREENGLVRLDGADFAISPEELSPTLALLERGPHITRLRFVDYRTN
jgi:hypothetical protein